MFSELDNWKARVLVVDDHPLVREALVALLQAEEDLAVCGQAEDRRGGLAAVTAACPDLAIIDLCLRASSGLDLIKDIRDQQPKTRTLVLSMQDESFYAERVVRAGASGYVSKRAEPARVIEAVRVVLAGDVYWDESVAREIASRLVQRNGAAKAEPLARLSEREMEIFELLGSGLGAAKIAASLHISLSTVETHRSRIKQKMNLRDASELRQKAIRWNVLQSNCSQGGLSPLGYSAAETPPFGSSAKRMFDQAPR